LVIYNKCITLYFDKLYSPAKRPSDYIYYFFKNFLKKIKISLEKWGLVLVLDAQNYIQWGYFGDRASRQEIGT
jgi:hypothetical protein